MHGVVAEDETGISLDDSELRLIGNSPGIRKVRELIGRVAPTESTVLIYGESGCGKELVAESVHAMSPRATRPFVAINCAAIPATCSAMSAAASRARCARVKESSSARTAGHCCSTRSRKCLSNCNHACCACSKPNG
jgi:sigma54-dependent transcription regulator